MADDAGEEKKLPPSQHKLQRLREREGQAARSNEMLTGGVLVAVLAYICISFAYIVRQLYTPLLSDPFSVEDSFAKRAGDLWTLVLKTGLNIVGPLLITIIFVSLFVSIIDVRGILISSKAITPSFEKLNPATNIKNIFGMKSLVTILKDIVRIFLLISGSFLIFILMINSLMSAPSCGQNCAMQVYAVIILGVVCLGVALVVLAALIDIPVSRFLFKRDNKMTLTEMKRENQDQFGHPTTRMIRNNVRQEAKKAMPIGIKRATFIVIGPDIAVALRYNTKENPLPTVVSKSSSQKEIKILDEYCQANSIPRIFDTDMARKMSASHLGTYPPVNTFDRIAIYLVALKLVVPPGA